MDRVDRKQLFALLSNKGVRVSTHWLERAVDYIFQHGGASERVDIVANRVFELFIDSDIYLSTNSKPLRIHLVDAGPHLSMVFVDEVKVFQIDEAIDMSTSHRERKEKKEKETAAKDSNGDNRGNGCTDQSFSVVPTPRIALKLFLSDGKQQMVALDMCGAIYAARMAAAQTARLAAAAGGGGRGRRAAPGSYDATHTGEGPLQAGAKIAVRAVRVRRGALMLSVRGTRWLGGEVTRLTLGQSVDETIPGVFRSLDTEDEDTVHSVQEEEGKENTEMERRRENVSNSGNGGSNKDIALTRYDKEGGAVSTNRYCEATAEVKTWEGDGQQQRQHQEDGEKKSSTVAATGSGPMEEDQLVLSPHEYSSALGTTATFPTRFPEALSPVVQTAATLGSKELTARESTGIQLSHKTNELWREDEEHKKGSEKEEGQEAELDTSFVTMFRSGGKGKGRNKGKHSLQWEDNLNRSSLSSIGNTSVVSSTMGFAWSGIESIPATECEEDAALLAALGDTEVQSLEDTASAAANASTSVYGTDSCNVGNGTGRKRSLEKEPSHYVDLCGTDDEGEIRKVDIVDSTALVDGLATRRHSSRVLLRPTETTTLATTATAVVNDPLLVLLRQVQLSTHEMTWDVPVEATSVDMESSRQVVEKKGVDNDMPRPPKERLQLVRGLVRGVERCSVYSVPGTLRPNEPEGSTRRVSQMGRTSSKYLFDIVLSIDDGEQVAIARMHSALCTELLGVTAEQFHSAQQQQQQQGVGALHTESNQIDLEAQLQRLHGIFFMGRRRSAVSEQRGPKIGNGTHGGMEFRSATDWFRNEHSQRNEGGDVAVQEPARAHTGRLKDTELVLYYLASNQEVLQLCAKELLGSAMSGALDCK